MVVFSNVLVVYFGLNYSSLFCVILVSGRRRIYIMHDLHNDHLFSYGIEKPVSCE